MKSFLIVLFALSFQQSANADGFICKGTKGTVITVFNHVQSSKGTRKVAYMTVSSPNTKTAGKRIKATFAEVKGMVKSEGTDYLANVDSRVSNVPNNGNIAGMDYSNLQAIRLVVGFNYSSDTPSESGTRYDGMITYYNEVKLAKIREYAECTRYKKN